MAVGRPWYKRSGGDFVMATMSMPDAETKWAYSAIIDILNDRDRPIDDDASFICGFTGLTRKKWSLVRKYLLKVGYLTLNSDGQITNPRFERERAARAKFLKGQAEAGRKGGQKSAQARQSDLFGKVDDAPNDPNALAEGYPEATLQTVDNSKPEQSRDQKTVNSMVNSTPDSTLDSTLDRQLIHSPQSGENNDLAEGYPQARARVSARKRLEKKERDSESFPEIENNLRPTDAPARAHARGTISATYRTVCDAAGYHPSDPDDIDKALSMLRSWLDAGADIETTILPTIRAVIAKSGDDITSSLKRFDRTMRHAIAKQATPAAPKPNGRMGPAAEAIFIFEGEDDRIAELRRDLAKAIGTRTYASLAHSCRFEPVDEAHAIRISGKTSDILKSGDSWPKLQSIAKRHGFNDIW